MPQTQTGLMVVAPTVPESWLPKGYMAALRECGAQADNLIPPSPYVNCARSVKMESNEGKPRENAGLDDSMVVSAVNTS